MSSAWFARINISTGCMVSPPGSFVGDFDRDFATIGFREISLVLQTGRHGAVAALMRVAQFVEIEQFRRQRLAARVSLTLVLVDADFQLSRHGRRFSLCRAACCANCVPHIIRRARASRPRLLSYSVLHSGRGCAVK